MGKRSHQAGAGEGDRKENKLKRKERKEKKKHKKSLASEVGVETDGSKSQKEVEDAQRNKGDANIEIADQRATEAVLRLAPENTIGPILISFANQVLPLDIEDLRFVVHGDNNESGKQRVVMGEGSRMDYWGMNFGPGSEDNDLCSYMVGVHDEGSGEITLYKSGHAFALRQSVAGKEEAVATYANEHMEWKEQKDTLINQFGSKKKKALIRARDANVIKVDSVVGGGSLSRVLAQALQEKGDDGAAPGEKADGTRDAVMEARRRFLPLFNEKAERVEEVYAAEDIAGGQELEAVGREMDREAEEVEGGLRQWIRDYVDSTGTGASSCPTYVSDKLGELINPAEPSQRQRLLELLYLRHMIVFSNSGNYLKGKPSILATEMGMPEIVMRHLLEKFSVQEGKGSLGVRSYGRTKTLKNQLLVHCLCLALVLEGCRLDFSQLAQDLKLTPTQSRQMLRELGCGATGNFAQLKLPLNFPMARKARK